MSERDALRAEIKELRRRLPRCNGTTESGFRCAQGVAHSGPHTHPNDTPVSGTPSEDT